MDQFRPGNLTQEAVEQFYVSGEDTVARILDIIHERVDRDFSPASALDFGCGVGRIALPLAKRCDRVVGVDVSDGMLRQARLRRDQLGLSNLRLVKGDDRLSAVNDSFDLITSYIVLQHIACTRGERLLARLLEMLNPGGIAALHLTYSKQPYDHDRMHLPPSWLRSCIAGPRRALRRCLSVLRRRPTNPGGEPLMQMNDYNLSRLFHFIQEAGVRRMHVEFTDHGGCYGVMLFFQKPVEDRYIL
jgi:SAM-dependent methyltransferase